MQKHPSRPKLQRCAIYTRKSTEHNLDLEFNSLDAQREACEAYIKSQAHEGWRLVPGRYDDGAFSGASLERPALQGLLKDVRAGRIDIIVVYKVDRLTRSLADFAKLVELFDAQAVSFVSVTQSFNTTSSMGRLTLNVLLSFAQFEREVIGERVRDKVAASKAKGIWVGGPIPLGYRSVDKKLVIVPEAAERVRMMFTCYLELGSLGALAQDLARRGIHTFRRRCDKGQTGAAVPFSVGALAHLLRNRFYLGEVVYRGETARGDHPAIIDADLFTAVQAKLTASSSDRQLKLRSWPALLTGRIFDDRGNRMTPTHTNKKGARYRYYVSHSLLQGRAAETGSVPRVAAPDIEALVIGALRNQLRDSPEANAPVSNAQEISERELIEHHVERVVVAKETITIMRRVKMTTAGERVPCEFDDGTFVQSSPSTDLMAKENAAACEADISDHSVGIYASAAAENALSKPEVLTIRWVAPINKTVKGIVHAPAIRASMTDDQRTALLTAIGKARLWVDELVAGRATSLADIAAREGNVERHIRLLSALAFVPPALVAAIADGAASRLTVTGLASAGEVRWERALTRPSGS